MEKILKEKNLEASIFQVEKGKKNGFKAFLNINGLPHLFTCIKSELSPLENSCLNEYELQNHIIELCFLPNKFTKLHNIIEFILQEIRNNIKFWILNSDIYSQIADNTKLLQDIQEVSIEKTEKTNKNDTNFEGIDNYLKYISQVTTLKRKYKFIQEYENIKEPEIIKPKIQENIPLIESNEKIIGDLLEEKNIQNIQTTQNNQELFEKFLLMNDTQRMTRHQKKRLCDDSNLISQDLSKYITQKSIVMRKKREAEILISIFMPNRFLKYPKIEFQVFPYIFKFLIKDLKTILDKKQEFHLQNFLFYMLLQEKQTKKKFRMNQNLFSDGQKDLEEEIPKANEEILSDEDKSLLDFYLFCHNDGFLIENLFFADFQLKTKQKILLKNVLALGKNYLNQKQNNIFFKTLNNIQNTEIDTSSFYKDILEDLENEYYKLDEELIEKLIDFYLVQVEQKKSSSDRNNETLHQFLCLNGNSNKNSDFMGRFSSNEKILEALHNYDEMINSPTMKKKRAYKFHSEDRGEWTETIYKKFLEGLLKYFDCSINNKKIAKFIGSSISANQVKFVKGKYLRRLKKRSKDVRIIVKDLLKEDICNFNMKIFEFISQITRKI